MGVFVLFRINERWHMPTRVLLWATTFFRRVRSWLGFGCPLCLLSNLERFHIILLSRNPPGQYVDFFL